MFPGFGASQGLERIDDIEDAAFHVLDVLDRLGLARCDLVGLSLGGGWRPSWPCAGPSGCGAWCSSIRWACTWKASPITEIFGRPLDELAGDLFADQDHPVAQLMRAMAALEADPAQIPFDLVRPILQAQAATAKVGWNPYLHDPKLPGRLARVSAPTLVVHARHDGIVPRAHAEAYAALIPDARRRGSRRRRAPGAAGASRGASHARRSPSRELTGPPRRPGRRDTSAGALVPLAGDRPSSPGPRHRRQRCGSVSRRAPRPGASRLRRA